MARGEDGQAMVEAALVLPSFLLLLLGAIQLTILQQARLAAEYAAFAAARAGIVMNGDPARMREAAAIAVLPAFGRSDGVAAIAKSLARFKAEEAALAPLGLELLRIDLHAPVAADFARFGQHLKGQELDFDDVRPAAAEATLLSLELHYLCELRVPFANGILQRIWLLTRGTRERAAPALRAAARAGRFYLPVRAFYTMRMQSNPYLRWARP
jgi:hypothetical protein